MRGRIVDPSSFNTPTCSGSSADDDPSYTDKATTYSSRKRSSQAGRRIIRGRIYDSQHGITCHWCRQKTVEDHVHCRLCSISFCGGCLRNRHGELIDLEMETDHSWVCPKCRGGCGPGCNHCCNCGPCRKVQGLGPTGLLIRTARASGFSNVHDFLIAQRTRESPQAIWERKRGKGWCRTGDLEFSISSDLIKQAQDAIAEEKAQKCSRRRLSFHSPHNSNLTEIPGCKNGHGHTTHDDDDDNDGVYGTKKKKKMKTTTKQDRPITVQSAENIAVNPQNIAVNPQSLEKHEKDRRKSTSASKQKPMNSTPSAATVAPHHPGSGHVLQVKEEKNEIRTLQNDHSSMLEAAKEPKIAQRNPTSTVTSTSGLAPLMHHHLPHNVKEEKFDTENHGGIHLRKVVKEEKNEIQTSQNDHSSMVEAAKEQNITQRKPTSTVTSASGLAPPMHHLLHNVKEEKFDTEDRAGIHLKMVKEEACDQSHASPACNSLGSMAISHVTAFSRDSNDAIWGKFNSEFNIWSENEEEEVEDADEADNYMKEPVSSISNEARCCIVNPYGALINVKREKSWPEVPTTFCAGHMNERESVEQNAMLDDHDDNAQKMNLQALCVRDGNEANGMIVKKSGGLVVHVEQHLWNKDDTFKIRLDRRLSEPFDGKELEVLMGLVSQRKPLYRVRETRNNSSQVISNQEGNSYLDHYPELNSLLESASCPMSKLWFLRGFFFWLENASSKGAFKPWISSVPSSSSSIDDDCMVIDGPDCEIVAVVYSIDDEDHDEAIG